MAKIHTPMDQAQIHNPLKPDVSTAMHKRQRSITVVPHGRLKERAAPVQTFAHDALQAITALVTAFPDLDQMLRQGRFELRQNKKTGKPLLAENLIMPLTASSLHLIPMIEGKNRGRGKAVLGLTLLGLSFIPGVNAGLGQSFGQFGHAVGGSALGASFQQFGSQLIGRSGSLLLLSGLTETIAPQASSPAGSLPSSSLPVPQVSGQGAAIPLVYGEVRITQPVVVSSGLDVDVIN